MEALQARRIEDGRQKDVLLQAVADRYCRRILGACMDRPRSAIEIAADGDVPISTVYRRLQRLHDGNVVRISGSISREGKKFFLYKSRVRSISASCDGGSVRVEVVPNPGQA